MEELEMEVEEEDLVCPICGFPAYRAGFLNRTLCCTNLIGCGYHGMG